MMFMWSKNGSGIDFPEDSAFLMGKGSGIRLIVLQVHYRANRGISGPESGGDTSGIELLYDLENERPKYRVGILSLHAHGHLEINRENSEIQKSVAKWESVCDMNSKLGKDDVIRPFAFLAHTHGRGRMVSGWTGNKSGKSSQSGGQFWSEIGRKNPQVSWRLFSCSPLNLRIALFVSKWI